MKRFLTFVFILGWTLYLKPGVRLPDQSSTLKFVSQVNQYGVPYSEYSAGVLQFKGVDGKYYYIPKENILYIIEEFDKEKK